MEDGVIDRSGRQEEELNRVTARIARSIITFCKGLRGTKRFHAEDLRTFVGEEARVAPGSADRVLRGMRQKGLLDYEVVNRAQSLYRLKSIGKKKAVP